MKRLKPYAILLVFFAALYFLPESAAEKARHLAASCIPSKFEERAVDLEVENGQLKQAIERLLSWISLEKSSELDLQEARRLLEAGGDPFFERRGRYLAQLIDLQLRGLPAQVIMRQPSAKSSQVWLNVGLEANEKVGAEVISVGSPVVVGKVVIGVVEEVLSNRCRVRLITDPSLNISVRCVRGHMQDAQLSGLCQQLATQLETRDELEGALTLSRALAAFSGGLDASLRTDFLAKGVLHGKGESWVGRRGHLVGEGFQYDFKDEEGPSRDLRTGRGEGVVPTPLISVGDLLVTTGLDGLFPPDLHVGLVTKIHPLFEGECAFELEAQALAPHFNQIKNVTVLPIL